MKTLRCDQCSSTDLTRLSEGEYRCNHCKAKLHIQPAPAPKVVVVAPSPPAKSSPLRTVATVVIALVLLVVAASLRAGRQERLREERRQRALQRDIARSIESRMGSSRLHVGEITGGRLAGSGGPLAGGSAGSSGDAPPPPPSKPVEYGSEAVVAPKAVRATFTDAVALPDRIGNIYFVGLYKNTGEAVIERPRVEATLWDSKKQKVAVGSGFAPFNNLLPGEEVPVKILVQHPPAHDSVTFHVAPEAMRYGSPQRFKLTVEKPKLEPAAFGGYRLTGVVRNGDSQDVQFVHIVGLLLDAKSGIVGLMDGFAGQRALPAGDHSPFSLQNGQVKAQPASFRLYTFAALGKP
jgi:hypothetical protein